MQDYFNYFKYVLDHKKNVWIEGQKLGVSKIRLLLHDLSKFSNQEFKQYAEYFSKKAHKYCFNCSESITDEFDTVWCKPYEFKQVYAKSCPEFKSKQTSKVELDFEYAWLHHQRNNLHHWQYWLRVVDKKIVPLEMPPKYVMEMIADWNAMSRKFAKGDISANTLKWYNSQTDIILHENTKQLVESVLAQA